jgi:Zn-dependent M28 family amino/carboxypeptidase
VKHLTIFLFLSVGANAAAISGPSAFAFTKRAVEFGPRPAGSAANKALQGYILAALRKNNCAPARCQIIEDDFMGRAPQGAVAMKNIIIKFPGMSGRAVAITGHFDTKQFNGRKFVGASDGGSSTGMLLELARVFATQPRSDDVYVVFFDGEEAYGEWSEADSLYGSRHLAAKWKADGTLARLKGLINVDMIGDRNLNLKMETNGNRSLNRLVWTVASELGYQAFFLNEGIGTDDDHMPFVKAGVPAIDLIDFDYPPWHTDDDTLDKLSPKSLEIVGTVVDEVVRRLEHQ